MTGSTAVAVREPSGRALSVFSSEADFAAGQRLCKAIVTSNLVPENYRGENNMGNALIALDMSQRMGLPPLIVMQNLDIIEGRPSWKSQFIISALNSCGLFSPIRFRIKDLGERDVSYERWSGPKGNRSKETVKGRVHDKEFIAYAVEKATGEVLEGPPVSIVMAVQEGWYHRSGSKWQSMPDLMGRYRSAAFFGRLYAPHILNGMPMADEVIDVEYEVVPSTRPAAVVDGDADTKPGRPKGVQAAMNAAKAADAGSAKAKPGRKAKAEKPAAEAQTQTPDDEAGERSPTQEDPDSAGESDDIFDAPDGADDDYEPA